ncbi:MAG: zinc-dependent metalloprotease, partial [Oligoflexia bacterium]|nr:zinc-dependent metalloprotease [Oligoflexia bacterium]
GAGLLGIAPSYVNPDTGQIIGTTSNIIIHNQETQFDRAVRNYIRYEIFQRDKRTDEENEIHVVSPYLKQQISKRCPEVTNFIRLIENTQNQLKPRRDINDREIIISCGKKLTKQALLGLILHEMGHSFGLAHNFKASVDSENYYQSEKEIHSIFSNTDHVEEIAHSSSVMDYTRDDYQGMEYLGKYDLAALRYLYLDEMELKDGSFLAVNINPDPKQQTALKEDILQKRKAYLHCSDFGLNPEELVKDPLCYPHDYGSSPKEIAEINFLSLKSILNLVRYRYDLDEDLFKNHALVRNNTTSYLLGRTLKNSLKHTILFYNRWLNLRNNYLESLHRLDEVSYILGDQSSIKEYQELLKKGLANKDYALYYPLRDLFPKMVLELMDLDEMKCHVRDSEGKEHHLVLENIKNLLRYNYGNSLYVEDCYSSSVFSFFSENNLSLIKQSGYENFISYYPETSSQAKWDVLPISSMLEPFGRNTFVSYKMINGDLLHWWNEPDWLKTLTLKAQENILDFEKNKTVFESEKSNILLHSALAGLTNTLSTPDKKHILAEHENNMRFVKYEKGTGPSSFYKQVTEPLGKGISIENIEVPFLTAVYNQYVEERSQMEFLTYLLKRTDTVNNEPEQIVIIPFEPNSFSTQVITKYNQTLRQLANLEKRTELSATEELHKEALKQHSKSLLGIIETIRLHR